MPTFALFGSPIQHSLSPFIHRYFACLHGFNINYQAIETHTGQLAAALYRFRQKKGQGANITLPLKEEALHLCDHLSKAAKLSGAVNTLQWKNNQLWGDNTDGEGLVQDLTVNLKLNLQNKRILILGTGGATRGIIHPLLARSATLIIVSRDERKAQHLAHLNSQITAFSYSALAQQDFKVDIIINATSSSLQNLLPPIAERWVRKNIVIDLAYRFNQPTVFVQWAVNYQANAWDGIGMLVEQAALSFQKWFQIKPNTRSLIEKLRQGDTILA